ncbi:MAG: hypothetical protein WBO10_10090 [Pyrinomonadaceae bacterium]
MITAADTKMKFRESPEWWKVALYDFVDDFRRHRDLQAVARQFPCDDERRDAVLAGVIETLCDEMKLQIPQWLVDVPSCSTPYFMAGYESLKAPALVQSPVRMRLRNVFVLENFLHRV